MLHYQMQEEMSNKVALLLGNSNYSLAPLPKCAEDACNLETKLKNLGYIVTRKVNLTHEEMNDEIDKFINNVIKPGDYVIFYFSGHGKQWGDQNYLIGCNDNPKGDAVNVQDKLNKMTQKEPGAIVAFLDCCREYVGKNEVIQGGTPTNVSNQTKTLQTFMVFACLPGEMVSGNGVFTKCLLEALNRFDIKNLEIHSFILHVANLVKKETDGNQVVQYVGSLTQHVYLFEKD